MIPIRNALEKYISANLFVRHCSFEVSTEILECMPGSFLLLALNSNFSFPSTMRTKAELKSLFSWQQSSAEFL